MRNCLHSLSQAGDSLMIFTVHETLPKILLLSRHYIPSEGVQPYNSTLAQGAILLLFMG